MSTTGSEQMARSTALAQTEVNTQPDLASAPSMVPNLGQGPIESVLPPTTYQDVDHIVRISSLPANLHHLPANGSMATPTNQASSAGHTPMGGAMVEDPSFLPPHVNMSTFIGQTSNTGANLSASTAVPLGMTPTFGSVPAPVVPRMQVMQEAVAPPSPSSSSSAARKAAPGSKKQLGRFQMEQVPSSPVIQKGRSEEPSLLPSVPLLLSDPERPNGVATEQVTQKRIGRFTVNQTAVISSPGGGPDDDFTDSTTPDSASMCTERLEGSSVGAPPGGNMSEILTLGRQFSVLFDKLVQAMRNLPSGGKSTMPGSAQGMSVPQSVLQMLQHQQALTSVPPAKRPATGSTLSAPTGSRWRGSGTDGTSSQGPNAINDEDGALNMWKNLGKPIELATKRNRQLEEEHQRLTQRLQAKRAELSMLQEELKQRETHQLLKNDLTPKAPRPEEVSLPSSAQAHVTDFEQDLTEHVEDSSDSSAISRKEIFRKAVTKKGRFKLSRSESLPDLLDVAMDAQMQALSNLNEAKENDGCSPEVKGYGTKEQYRHTREYHYNLRVQEQAQMQHQRLAEEEEEEARPQ